MSSVEECAYMFNGIRVADGAPWIQDLDLQNVVDASYMFKDVFITPDVTSVIFEKGLSLPSCKRAQYMFDGFGYYNMTCFRVEDMFDMSSALNCEYMFHNLRL